VESYADTGIMPKRPRDLNQLAKLIVDIATGEVDDVVSESKRHPPARAIGGLKGGKARAMTLSPAARKRIAQKAAAARWKR
jgi:hypothetical protein